MSVRVFHPAAVPAGACAAPLLLASLLPRAVALRRSDVMGPGVGVVVERQPELFGAPPLLVRIFPALPCKNGSVSYPSATASCSTSKIAALTAHTALRCAWASSHAARARTPRTSAAYCCSRQLGHCSGALATRAVRGGCSLVTTAPPHRDAVLPAVCQCALDEACPTPFTSGLVCMKA